MLVRDSLIASTYPLLLKKGTLLPLYHLSDTLDTVLQYFGWGQYPILGVHIKTKTTG